MRPIFRDVVDTTSRRLFIFCSGCETPGRSDHVLDSFDNSKRADASSGIVLICNIITVGGRSAVFYAVKMSKSANNTRIQDPNIFD